MIDEKILEKVQWTHIELLKIFDTLCRKYNIKYCLSCGSMLGAVRHKGFIPWDNDIDIWMTRTEFEKFYAHQEELPDDYLLIMPTMYGANKYLDAVPRIIYKKMGVKVDKNICEYYNNYYNKFHLDIFFIDKTYSNWRGFSQKIELIVLYALANGYRCKSFVSISNSKPYFRIFEFIFRNIGKLFSLNWLFKKIEKTSVKYNGQDDANYYFESNASITDIRPLIPCKYLKKIIYQPFESITAPVPEKADKILTIWYGDYMVLPPKEERVPHWGVQKITLDQFVLDDLSE